MRAGARFDDGAGVGSDDVSMLEWVGAPVIQFAAMRAPGRGIPGERLRGNCSSGHVPADDDSVPAGAPEQDRRRQIWADRGRGSARCVGDNCGGDLAVQYGCRVPEKRLATQHADAVVRARQSGDVNSERRVFANLAAACRELGVSVDTLLADAEYRARAQVPPHH